MPFAGIYTSTKHALKGIMEALRDELTGTGVEVCAINPGAFKTGFNDAGALTMMGSIPKPPCRGPSCWPAWREVWKTSPTRRSRSTTWSA
ncbi:MAG: SDR family NAD(P)-dependent oxidoreductase [Sinorhizobium meliloti]|nr:SDR family NAD(P)-dependent oxidoreductase [Sinorhizobium meliloti]